MTQRENFLRIIAGQPHEFIPVDFSLCPALIEQYHRKTGAPVDYDYWDYFDFACRNLPVLQPDDPDLGRFLQYHPDLDDHTTIDWVGVGHRSSPNSFHMTQMLHPLGDADSAEQLLAYPLPAFSAGNNPGLKEAANRIHAGGHASVGDMPCTVWETAWYVRGMENLMMDMMSDDPMADVMLDRITDMSVQRAKLYANAGVDILYLGDDIGMQSTIMMSEQLYCDWLKPRLKRVIDAARAIKPDIIVFYHSCGHVTELIPHLIDAGINVLNPIQPESMDFEEVYRDFGDRLAFHGTIGTQSVMPLGTPDDVRRAVNHNLDIADHGRLLVAPTHLLEPDVTWANVMAYVEACRSRSKM